jgi:glycolate oxidase
VRALLEASGATEVRVSRDEAERLRFWAGRKAAFPAAGRISPDYYCMDGTIPRKRLGEMLQAIQAMERKYAMRCINVFHAGDGNLHPLILFDANKPGDQHTAEAFGAEILELSVALGGTITGEHGVGIEKINQMCSQFATPEILAFHRVKAAFDPAGLLNPGKAIPTLNRCAEYGRERMGSTPRRIPSCRASDGNDPRGLAAVPVCGGAGAVAGRRVDGAAHRRAAGGAPAATSRRKGRRA